MYMQVHHDAFVSVSAGKILKSQLYTDFKNLRLYRADIWRIFACTTTHSHQSQQVEILKKFILLQGVEDASDGLSS